MPRGYEALSGQKQPQASGREIGGLLLGNIRRSMTEKLRLIAPRSEALETPPEFETLTLAHASLKRFEDGSSCPRGSVSSLVTRASAKRAVASELAAAMRHDARGRYQQGEMLSPLI